MDKKTTFSPITSEHRVSRRPWAEDHNECQMCLFTDESRFCLTNRNECVIIWRERGQRFIERYRVPITAFGGGSICILAEICFDGRTDLVILVNATMTADRYRGMVTTPLFEPSAGATVEYYGKL